MVPMRAMPTYVLVVALLGLTVAGVFAEPDQLAQRLPTARLERPVLVQKMELTPLLVTQQFQTILSRKGVTGPNADRAMESFRKLPVDLQADVVMVADPDLARMYNREAIAIARFDPRLLELVAASLFRINSFWPDQGAPGVWSYAFGNGFNNDCKVYFDGNQVESHYLSEAVEFFPNCMAFKVPLGASRAQEHDVYVRNTASAKNTETDKYMIVAPRGYRGYHGWKFSNFSRPTIDWKLYADYFGRLNVEYANGTHRPAAQAYYDSTYTSAGNGGNCYGMSVSSLRVRNHEFDHMFHASYFQNAPTMQTYQWWYDWIALTRETVQQQQGAWFTQEILDLHNNFWNNQDARDVFTRCEALLPNVIDRPVLVYWGPSGGGWWGHVVCPYKSETVGDSRRMIVYDNNNPYRENESGAVDPDVATVNWAANTFSRGSATKAELFSYEECTPADPHLPGSEYGGPGANAVVAVFSPNTRVQQITDEAGRRFFNPDGSLNEDPASRIPNSSIVPPLLQRLPQPQPRPAGPIAQIAQINRPANSPLVFVFEGTGGRSLTFDLAGQGAKLMHAFQNGNVFQLEAAGAGQVRLNSLLQGTSLQVLNAQALNPTALAFMRSTAPGDRVFRLNNIRNLGAGVLELLPDAQGAAVEVLGPPNLQFNLDLQGPVGQGMQEATFGNIALQAGAKANLAPLNWTALQTGGLRLQMLNLQNNAVLNQQTLQRIQ